MSEEIERKLFEAWLKREQPSGCLRDLWAGWQAARATPAEAPVAWMDDEGRVL